MKKIFLLFALLACSLGMTAADKVELTRLAYDDGGYIYSTLLTSGDTPFATIKKGTGENGGEDATFVLLSREIKPVYSFTIKTPDNISGWAGSGTLSKVGENDNYIQEILITQHLFNDDDLYEVVFCFDDYDTYMIYNEKGENLGTLPGHKLYYSDGVYYVYSEYDSDNAYGDSVSALYEIKKGGSAVAQVKAEAQTLSVAPNPVGYEETATLSLPSDMLQGGVVKVFDLNGTLLFNKECKAGDTEILIPAYRLNAGVNPVVVADGEGNILGSGKIIRK